MTDWYNLSWPDIVNLMQSNANKGLSENDVLKNRKVYGENIITGVENKKVIKNILMKVKEPWFIDFFSALCLFAYLHLIGRALLILIIMFSIILIVGIGKYNEHKRVAELGKFNTGKSTVLRNGNLISIKNTEVVLGDIVIYKKGSVIPADLRIMDCEDLKIKETFVTGDNNTIEKYSAKLLENELNLSEMRNILFKSSVVQSGSGEGIVVAVGMNTEIGKIMQKLLDIEKEENAFYKGIYEVVNVIASIGIVGSIAIFILKTLAKAPVYTRLTYVANLLLLTVPFGIPIILSFIWLILKRHMAKNDISVSGLSVIQDISRINAICIDKEGVLTEEVMVLKNIYDNSEIINTYDVFQLNDNLRRILEIGILCNDADSIYNNKTNKADLVERAIISFANSKNMEPDEIQIKHKRMFEIPYDKERRIKTTLNKVDRKYRANVKGAVDVLLEECTHILKNGIEKEITEEDILSVKENDIEMSNNSLYVIGIAYRNFTYKPSNNENIESNLVFVGLMAFSNPLKEGVIEAVNKTKLLAVKPVIITEDSKLTAIAFGKSIGVINIGDVVLSGIEIDNTDAEELARNIEKSSVYSRIISSQKLKLVNLYKDKDYYIALTGSKLIDLPSLRVASLSIAFGEHCSNMVKKLSDVYIKQINLLKLVNLTEESRNVMNSFKEIIKYLCMCSLSELILYGLIAYNSEELPLTTFHVIWLNILNAGISSIAIFSSRKYLRNYIHEKNLIDKRVWKKYGMEILFCASVVGLITYIAYKFSNNFNPAFTQNITFSILCFGQIIILYSKTLVPKIKLNIHWLIFVILNVFIMIYNYSDKSSNLKLINLFGIELLFVCIFVEVLILQIKKLFRILDSDETVE